METYFVLFWLIRAMHGSGTDDYLLSNYSTFTTTWPCWCAL